MLILSVSGVEEFLLYSINWEVKGLALDTLHNNVEALGPISRVSMATSIDFNAGQYTNKIYVVSI